MQTQQGNQSQTFRPPSTDGSLVLPQIFDYNGTQNKDHTLFRYHDDVSGAVVDISWGKANRAFHTAARIVQEKVKDIGTRPVVAILAAADTITYYSMIAGIMRAGAVAFPVSVRNSDAGIVHLLRKTGATHMFVSQDPGMQGLAAASLKQMPDSTITTSDMPSFDALYSAQDGELLPEAKNISLDDRGLILHSSGSTAFPKPITFTYRILMESGLLPYYGELDLCGEILSSHAVPMFHLMGAVQVAWTSYTGLTISVFKPGMPTVPTPDRVYEGAIATKSTMIFCVPAFLEAWARDPARLPALQAFNTIIFAGGPLQPHIGDMLVEKGCCIVPLYGQTETGTVTLFLPKQPPPEGYAYFRFSPHVAPVFVPYEENSAVHRLLVKKTAVHTPAVINTEVDGVPALDTNDLVERHPTNPDLWRVFGRSDDQVMHSTGEKTNPVPIEDILAKDPKIHTSIVFGRGRFHAGVIVQPTPNEAFASGDVEKLAAFRNEIWPSVEAANRIAPQHSRIFKEMIIVADPSKPFEFTPKGTPRRQAVLDAYASEIDAAYEAVTESSQIHLAAPSEWSQGSALTFVRQAVDKVLLAPVKDDDDLFQSGCDSLQATWIRNTIIHALRASTRVNTREIPPNFVYTYPTVSGLATYLYDVVCGTRPPSAEEQAAAMVAMARKYSTIDGKKDKPMTTTADTALLTGSTGYFGTYILDALLHDPGVKKVYVLNRSDAPKRQKEAFADKHMDVGALERVVFLEGDISQVGLGLAPEVYEELLDNVSCVIHNAWRVNFNVGLATNEPLVAGTRYLVDLALAARPAAARFVFISSAGVFRNIPSSTYCPETYIEDPKTVAGWGYSESKWVAEHILEQVAQQTALKPLVIRPGQLSGGPNGYWNTKEWFPALVKASQTLGKLPDLEGKASWIPIDVAARTVVELRTSEHSFVNVAHPTPGPALDVMKPLSAALGLPLVSYTEWTTLLEKSGSAPGLLEFFRGQGVRMAVDSVEALGFPSLEVKKGLDAPALAGTVNKPLGEADAARWLAYWLSVGFVQGSTPVTSI